MIEGIFSDKKLFIGEPEYISKTNPENSDVWYRDFICYKIGKYHFNPQAPVAQKVADEVIFRRFQGEGVKFC